MTISYITNIFQVDEPFLNNINSCQHKSEYNLITYTNLQMKNEECKHSDNDQKGEETNEHNQNFPTLSEAVLNMFIEEKTQISEIDEEKSDTEEFRVDSLTYPNKPTAIVKPCQKLEIEDLICETKEDPIKISKLKPLVAKNSVLLEENESAIKDKQTESHVNNRKTETDILELKCKLKSIDEEKHSISKEILNVDENNKQMMIIVKEFEKTINQLVEEREREEVCQQIMMER